MGAFERLHSVAVSDGQRFIPLCLVGIIVQGNQIATRIVGDELLLVELLRQTKGDRTWLHLTVDGMCDGLKPPDDQPKETFHMILEEPE